MSKIRCYSLDFDKDLLGIDLHNGGNVLGKAVTINDDFFQLPVAGDNTVQKKPSLP